MSFLARAGVALLVAALVLPSSLLAQAAPATDFRPFASVLIAFAVSWTMVAAWVARIGMKVNRIIERLEAQRSDHEVSGDAM